MMNSNRENEIETDIIYFKSRLENLDLAEELKVEQKIMEDYFNENKTKEFSPMLRVYIVSRIKKDENVMMLLHFDENNKHDVISAAGETIFGNYSKREMVLYISFLCEAWVTIHDIKTPIEKMQPPSQSEARTECLVIAATSLDGKSKACCFKMERDKDSNIILGELMNSDVVQANLNSHFFVGYLGAMRERN